MLAYENDYIRINEVSYAHTHSLDHLKSINEPVNRESMGSFILCLCYSAQKWRNVLNCTKILNETKS